MKITVPPDALDEGNPGSNTGGIYKLVVSVFLNSNFASPGFDMTGFNEGPISQVEDLALAGAGAFRRWIDEWIAREFRDLKGIGPATEARLYQAGIYAWEALAVAATALAGVRGNGDTLREVANLVAARHGTARRGPAPRLPGGEHLEAFVLRMALTADHEPQRCTVTHVRTMAEQAWGGWAPAD